MGASWTSFEIVHSEPTAEYPSIVIDGGGNLHAAYLGERNGIKYTRRLGTGWAPSQLVEALPPNSTPRPSLAVDGAGKPHISYNGSAGRMRYATTGTGAGTIWFDDVTLTSGGSPTFTTQYKYDSLNRIFDMTYPDNEIVRHSYNAQGLLEKIRSVTYGFDYVSNLNYNALGQVTERALGNGLLTQYQYKPGNFRLHSIFTTAGSMCHQSLAYSYDPVGNVTEISDYRDPTTGACGSTPGPNTQRFGAAGNDGYDPLNRLRRADGPYGSQSYVYNPIGNMTDGAGSALSYPLVGSPRPHAPTTANGCAYGYDSNGNMTSRTCGNATRAFTWDFDNRLTRVQENGVTLAEFGYDSAGQRVKKTTGGNTTLYIGKHYECMNGICSKFIFSGRERVAIRPVGFAAPPDTTPPIISGVAVGSITSNGATITWTTNEVSDTQVEFGTTTSYGSSTALNITKVTSHSATLSGLSASTLYHYRVKSKDAVGNPAVSSDFTFTTSAPPDSTPPTPPSTFVAVATGATQVTLTWTASTDNVGVSRYEVERKSNNGPYVVISSPTTNNDTDNGVSANTTYLYRVRAFDAAGNPSVYSNIDLATTLLFTDNPLVASAAGTFVKAAHLTELRQAVNAVRVAAGLAAVTWTDPTLSGIFIKAVHLQELRNNLNPALTTLGFTAPTYTDPTLTAGSTVIKKAHIEELRHAVK